MPDEERAALERQHEDLRGLSDRLGKALARSPLERGPVAEALAGLIAVLFQHEEAESAFLRARLKGSKAGERTLQAMENEHVSLLALVKDIQIVMGHPELYSLDHLSGLAGRFRVVLQAHLELEEKHVYGRPA
ncbi:MAG: hemerythrin domain-containing protein [Elusimicrobia bacterium]|nr:hemerythrin domain-containing protein [Elusimicrobiota bacterium]